MKRGALIALAVTALGLPALGDDAAGTWGPLSYNPALPHTLTLQGEIEDDVMPRLRRALRDHPDTDTLFLDSPGGSVFAALELGAAIHDRGLSTVVPAGAECASSCAYAFIAGKERVLRGKLGVHQFTSPDGDAVVSEAETQGVVGEIVGYLKEFDAPMIFVLRMLEAPNDDMHWFTAEEIREGHMDTGGNYDARLAAWTAHYSPWEDPLDTAPTPAASVGAKGWQTDFAAPVSVDCDTDSTAPWQTAICGDDWLFEINLTLADEERAAMAALSGGAATANLAAQWQWVKERNACGDDEACIASAATRRMAVLEATLDAVP